MTPPPTISTRDDPDADRTPPWGLRHVGVAVVGALVASSVLGGVVMAVAGVEDRSEASLVVVALGQAALWVSMLGAVAVVLRLVGARPRVDLGLSLRPLDLPLGIALGVACQLVLVPAISGPWSSLLGLDPDELKRPACELAEKADDPVGVGLLFLTAVVGAGIVEEVFFRGFVQRAAVADLERAASTGVVDGAPESSVRRTVTAARWIGLVGTALLFGLMHYQLQQLAALVVFGLILGVLAQRTGRLGPSIVTHMAFNATTVVSLVVLSDSIDASCGDVLGLVGLLGLP